MGKFIDNIPTVVLTTIAYLVFLGMWSVIVILLAKAFCGIFGA